METTENVYVLTKRNAERARAVKRALVKYSVAKGEGRDVDSDTARDFLQDLMHWEAKRQMKGVYGEEPGPADYEQVRDTVQDWFQAAYNDFPNEAGGKSEDEIGPCIMCGTQCYPDSDGGSVVCPKCKDTEQGATHL